MYDERIDRRSGYFMGQQNDHSSGQLGDYAGEYAGDYVGGHVTNHVTDYMTDHAGDRPLGHQAAGTGRHRAPERFFSTPLVPPDSGWDPAEELAFMLQDAMQEANSPKIPGAREEHPSARDEYSYPREENPVPRDETPVTEPVPGSPLDNLREITAELPPLRRLKGEAPRGHRKVRRRGS